MNAVDVSVWRADIERQMAEFHRQPPTMSLELAGEAPCDRCVTGPMPPVYIVGEGVPCETPTGCPKFTRQMCPYNGNHPPVGWPSPNETTPCAECDGQGWTVEGQNYHDPYGDKIECDECGGSGVTAGTRTELRVTCDKCEGRSGTHDVECYYCDSFNPGSVLWATATWVTLPVVPYDQWAIDFFATGSSQPDCVVNIGTLAILVGPDGRGQTLLPLAAGSVRPGMWVAQLTEIELT